jgi:hypothetical protein
MKVFQNNSWQKNLQGLIDNVFKNVLVVEKFYKI